MIQSSRQRQPMRRVTIPNKDSLLILLLISILVVIALLSGCEKEPEMKSAIIPEEETIVVVNNKRISLARFQRRLSLFLKQYGQLMITDEKQLAKIKDIVINRMIDEELISQEASRKGIKVSNEEIETEIADTLANFGKSDAGYGQNPPVKELDRTDLNQTEWENRLRQLINQKKLVQQEVIEKVPITKREIVSYYQTHRREFTRPRAYKVRNITLATYAEAVAIRLKIKLGTNFRFLVREHSISPDKAVDGDLGYIERGDLPLEMESEIFRSSYKSRGKDISNIVRSQDGFHIFKRERYRRRRRMSLKQARPEIKKILVTQKRDAAYQRWLEKLKKNAKISIDKAMLASEEGF